METRGAVPDQHWPDLGLALAQANEKRIPRTISSQHSGPVVDLGRCKRAFRTEGHTYQPRGHMPSTLEVDPAVLTLVGTLTGIVITALFGLLTAYLAQRWQFSRTEQEHRLQVDREVREARRQTYARYIASAQQVFDRAVDLYAKYLMLRNTRQNSPYSRLPSWPMLW